jgi:GNAT superfamily N-acetyltransferase
MTRSHLAYEIDDTLARIDFDRVFAWLASTYWWNADTLTREKTERGARHSALVVGVYTDTGDQVAYARVVSDAIRFAWLADVFVAEPHRQKGIARALVRFAIEHPALADVHRWLLATRDAHALYAAEGFTPLASPDHMMELRRSPARKPCAQLDT